VIVAMAERLNITRILTLDRRDFQLIRQSIAAVLKFCHKRLLDRASETLEPLKQLAEWTHGEIGIACI